MRGPIRSAPLLVALLAACHPARSAPAPRVEPSASVRAPSSAESGPVDSTGAEEAPPAASASAAPTPPPRPLPDGVKPGVPVTLKVPHDAAARVIHAEAGNREAIVYLPGLCGDITAVDSWARAASLHGTLVAVNGDIRCHGSRRYRWSRNITRIQKRIDRALAAVEAARGGQLATKQLTLIGYSQGATRAQSLAARYPDRYPRVLLGSPPVQPTERKLASAKAVVVVGGQREAKGKMRAGVRELSDAGEPVRLMVLPATGHGHYGPEANRVMGQALDFLFRVAPPVSARPSQP